MKTKILHICNLGMNGKAVFVSNLLNETDFDKYDITILNFWGQIAPSIAKRLEGLPVTIDNPGGGGFVKFIRKLTHLLKNNNYDVVHSHMWDLSGIFLLLAKWYRVPVRVSHSHNSFKVQGRYNIVKEFIRDKIIWKVLKFSIEKNANRYLSCSQVATKWLYTKRIENKAIIVNNGIDLSVFRPANRHLTNTILFVGRFTHQKNPSFAYEVFKEYKKRNNQSKFVMVGGGDSLQQSELEKKAQEDGLLDSITFIGSTSEIQNYYNNSDVLLMPSLYEGLPLTLIEAQACGIKCLVSDSVTKECDCGLIQYKSLNDSIKSWAKALEDIHLQDLKIDTNALNKFDRKKTAELVYKIYEK